MVLVGITGAIGHGKSTFAEALHIQEPNMLHLETNMPIMDIANALLASLPGTVPLHDIKRINNWLKVLPAIVDQKLHRQIDADTFLLREQDVHDHPEDYAKLFQFLEQLGSNPTLAREIITARNKNQYRSLLQWIGGIFVQRLDNQVWIAEVIERATEYRDAGGVLAVIGGIRFPIEAETVADAKGIVTAVVRPGTEEADIDDPTEKSRRNIQPQTTIYNSGTVLDLLDVAERFLRDAAAGTVRTEYRSV